MKHIKTSTGFELDATEGIENDMEVLELVYDIEDGNTRAYFKLIDKLMSPEDKKRLYDHVRVNGRVPIEAFAAELTEIMKELNSTKK